MCPDQYRAIESAKDCEDAAKAGMQGLPPPSKWEKNDPNNQGLSLAQWEGSPMSWLKLRGEANYFGRL